MSAERHVLPPPHDRCRLTVVIPAKNERELLERTLRALEAQRELAGDAPIDPRSYDVIVFCNDCEDDTAAVARRFARRTCGPLVHVIEQRLPSDAAHIGTARRMALERAAERFERRGMPGVIASTDADTIVATTWVSATLREMAGADAVAGWVTVGEDDRAAMTSPQRRAYEYEVLYRRSIGLIEERFDPRPYEPSPRHDAFVGASFAVTVRAYRDAGGLPAVARLEDRDFESRLACIDARVRHSYDVRAFTSARSAGRVDGGFASFLRELDDLGRTRCEYRVRSGRAIVAEAIARRLARAVWSGVASRAELDDLSRRTRCDIGTIADLAKLRRFGEMWATLRDGAAGLRYPDEPVQRAIASMQDSLVASDAAVPLEAATSQAV
jgi:hypothetical protein